MPANRLFCPYCGSINREEAKFCLRCGRRLRTLCNVCGHSNGIDVSFCLQCGTRLANQKPIDRVIGYFVKNRDWQNTLVTTGDMEPIPLIRYIWAEMVRMGLRPLFIQWEQSESPIEELLVHIVTSLDAVDKRPEMSLHRIIEKIKSRLLSIAPDEAISLINERLKNLEQSIALLMYLPSCPISYSAWKFTQDYSFLTRRLALPVFTITTSPLMPVYAGFFAENKDNSTAKRVLYHTDSRVPLLKKISALSALSTLSVNRFIRFCRELRCVFHRCGGGVKKPESSPAGILTENREPFSMQRWLQERHATQPMHPYHVLTLISAYRIRHMGPGDTVEIGERKIVCYPALEPTGYILASLIPNLSIQIRAQGTWNANTDARKIGWKQIAPAWGDLPEELLHKLLDNMPSRGGRKFQVVTFYLYQAENEEENVWSHIAFIPPDTIARLQAPGVLEEDFILIY
jgi:hypothetical protein